MKRLAWLSVEDYAATQMERVVVSAMKGYLRRMPEKEALKKVEGILDPKVIRLAGDDGAPMPVQSNVDGAKLAAFIDAAVADSTRELEKREDDLSGAGVTMLGNVDGKSMVEQMKLSVSDCLREGRLLICREGWRCQPVLPGWDG